MKIKFVAHFKGLAHGANDAHGLGLQRERWEKGINLIALNNSKAPPAEETTPAARASKPLPQGARAYYAYAPWNPPRDRSSHSRRKLHPLCDYCINYHSPLGPPTPFPGASCAASVSPGAPR